MRRITTLLVANRGEIACRVLRTARDLGLRCVAVYSEADAESPHIRLADEAVCIGPAAVTASYLNTDAILAAAKATGADALHPGYGFLSENAEFAEACEAAGLIFVGPPAEAMRLMGDKARAKRRMIEAGVPCIEGYQGADTDPAVLMREAERIGFPVMLKAVAGGGGRGMRRVASLEDLDSAIRLAGSEAANAFGNGDLLIEKAVERPRHVEVQVFADQHGQTIHLGERDCSVQRRHQKVIEEAPCPVMTETLRAEMGAAAVEAARAVNYVGAGTVEFLLDEDGRFYFLEMNTRLQVEHPVTEAILGQDLVAWQIAVAQGEPLPLSQDEVLIRGHAIEVRLYAEDPGRNFLPSTGPVLLWTPPSGPGVRVDDGIETGGQVSPFYDAMLAKIIAHGATREEARRRLRRALGETALFGLKTNRDFLIDALGQPDFVTGQATTAFIEETYGEAGFRPPAPSSEDLASVIALDLRGSRESAVTGAVHVDPELLDWTSAGRLESSAVYGHGEREMTVTARSADAGCLAIGFEEAAVRIGDVTLSGPRARLRVEGEHKALVFHRTEDGQLFGATPMCTFQLQNMSQALVASEDASRGGRVSAPMHGKLVSLTCKPGDAVARGDVLGVLEAMKMQHEIIAGTDGKIRLVAASPGVQLAANDLILEIEPDEGD